MSNTKHEDAIMKMGFGYFRDTILEKLGIHYEFDSGTPTELIELTIHTWYMDFTFLTKDGFYVHIEFQTTETDQSDLLRFRAYEAVLGSQTGRDVLTYVIYSGGIRHTKTELDCGFYTYRVEPVYLSQYDADKLMQHLKEKRAFGEPLTEDDFASLALIPLMTSEHGKKKMIKDAIILAKQTETLTAQKTIAILYTLADKFLNQMELQEIREVVAMTRLGQMIFDDGMERGAIEKLAELVIKRMQKGDTPEQIAELLDEDINRIREIYFLAQKAGSDCNVSQICEKILQK
ncbi:hypothetical protein NE634_06065 [Lacrimispora saccharolytica]|nr:hypothetical protein [Lacrimispora saccharolytica]